MKNTLIDTLSELSNEDKLNVLYAYICDTHQDWMIFDSIDDILEGMTPKQAVETFHFEKLNPYDDKFWHNGVNYYSGNINDLIEALWYEDDIADWILRDPDVVDNNMLPIDLAEIELLAEEE